MAGKTRRTRTDHPGVYIRKRVYPSGAVTWRARFIDPDSGKEDYLTLTPEQGRTQASRRVFAVQKSKALQARKSLIDAGAPLRSQTELGPAIDQFYEAASNRLRASTLTTYRHGIERVRNWAATAKLPHTEDLTPPKLLAYRDWLIAEGKRSPARDGRRGEHQAAPGRRSVVTTNSYLTSAKILLNHLRARGITPDLTKDAIGDALKPLAVAYEDPEYLSATEIGQLLRAAMRHDETTFAETRTEHVGLAPRGKTRRYAPIAPLVAFMLLSGCRRGEALALRWSDVDLAAKDPDGRVVGEIRLRGATTKTKRARIIGLEVSPGLRRLLASLKLGVREREAFVFGGADPYTGDTIDSARARMVDDYGAPIFTWQRCRQTCATYLTCSTAIWGSATVFLSARQLGHSVTVAEKHYLGTLRGVPREARTLEAAMGIEAELGQVTEGDSVGVREVTCG